ncbi:MAG TPA: type II toxin-antitoxin system ParD family antitoxin [Pyrinomonadaceae bacterium]|nr:type II toxin-antitoxin system ParD family antitoxin [Pyrinomonadaceae bacterium]
MTITLTDEMEELINVKIKSGEYKSADEVVMASLRLLKAKEDGVEALRREIMHGIEDIQQGRFAAYTTDAEIEAFSDDIIRQGQERLNASGKQ